MEKETLRVVDMRDQEQMVGQGHIMHQMLDSQSTCIFSHLDDRVLLGDMMGKLIDFDIRAGDAVNFQQAHGYGILDLQMSKDQAFVISASSDKTAKLHDARTLNHLKTYK